jgi:hypothetical protein
VEIVFVVRDLTSPHRLDGVYPKRVDHRQVVTVGYVIRAGKSSKKPADHPPPK